MSEVTLLWWPADEERRRVLRSEGRLRLLLVDGDAAPPEMGDPNEDWIRTPAPPDDVRARVRGLEGRRRGADGGRPALDGDGVLHVGGRCIVLPPVEARLAAELVERFGSVVSRDALSRAGWPDGMSTRNLLDVRMLRLRRRLLDAGLTVRTVRHRGYLLEHAGGQTRDR